jgi:hypothetical protein
MFGEAAPISAGAFACSCALRRAYRVADLADDQRGELGDGFREDLREGTREMLPNQGRWFTRRDARLARGSGSW